LPFVRQLYEFANAENNPIFDYLLLSNSCKNNFSTASFFAKVSDKNLTNASIKHGLVFIAKHDVICCTIGITS
jgi:hypothetical protein